MAALWLLKGPHCGSLTWLEYDLKWEDYLQQRMDNFAMYFLQDLDVARIRGKAFS